MLKLKTAPTLEPVTRDEAKAHLRITYTDEDSQVDAIITAARQIVEETSWRAIMEQTWRLSLPAFPLYFLLPRPPLLPPTPPVINYIDPGGTMETVDSSVYHVAYDAEPGLISLKSGQSWPATQAGNPEAVQVEYTAGYGALASDVPANVKQAILLVCGDLWANREDVVVGTIAANIGIAERILDTFIFRDERILPYMKL